MKKYTPAPVDLKEVNLPKELNELLEQIAKNVHEVWATNRIKDGWKYGKQRDDNLKLHPGIVPYEDLSEKEKDYDRATAIASLRLVYKLT